MKTHFLPVTKTARIASLGESGAHVTDVCIALHGYAQLSQYFLKQFEGLEGQQGDKYWQFFAPEGLSRFYREGFYGKVGASWMTKEDRLWEIEDQKNYLNDVVKFIQSQSPQARIHLLGFSQGVATAWRWLCNGAYAPSSFIIWAGEIPQEFPDTFVARTKNIPLVYVLGRQDEFISEAQAVEYLANIKDFIPHLQLVMFEGNHSIEKVTLQQILLQLKREA